MLLGDYRGAGETVKSSS